MTTWPKDVRALRYYGGSKWSAYTGGSEKGQRGLLDHLVGSSEAALVLAKVFLPGGHAEDLNKAIGVFAISV